MIVLNSLDAKKGALAVRPESVESIEQITGRCSEIALDLNGSTVRLVVKGSVEEVAALVNKEADDRFSRRAGAAAGTLIATVLVHAVAMFALDILTLLLLNLVGS